MTEIHPEAGSPVVDLYLESFLKPFRRWLDDPAVTEILVNRPGEVWVETAGTDGLTVQYAAHIDNALLKRLAEQVARINHQAINRFYPLMSASLPTGERVQIIAPPTSGRDWALAIRRHRIAEKAQIDDFLPVQEENKSGRPAGAFPHGNEGQGNEELGNEELSILRQKRAFREILLWAVASRQNILLSGGTSSGKTTLLAACLQLIPKQDRIITIEDARELVIPQPNHLSLVSVKGALGEAKIDVPDLLQAALRMRPDRIILGEIRGPEALVFLRSINTGHPGSLSTVHANSPQMALEQLALMVLEAGFPLSRDATLDYLCQTIGLIVQVERVGRKRYISDIVRPHIERIPKTGSHFSEYALASI